MAGNKTAIRKYLFRLPLIGVAAGMILSFNTACGSLTSETKLRIRFMGSLTKPAGATGTESPMSQVYLFENISLQPADGSAAISLYTDDAVELRVVSRPQEVWSTTELSDVTDKEFSSATVSFDPLVVVVDQDGESHNITLDTGDLVMSEGFTITDGDETVITIRAHWGKTITPPDGDTITTTTVSAPSFQLSLGD